MDFRMTCLKNMIESYRFRHGFLYVTNDNIMEIIDLWPALPATYSV